MLNFQLSETVKQLIIINVLFFFGALALMGPEYWVAGDDGSGYVEWGYMILGIFMPFTQDFQPFQIVTHMFIHADGWHLAFNMFALFFFGPRLEMIWGAKRFLFYYFFCGFGSLILFLLLKYLEITTFYGGDFYTYASAPMLGASGAIMGVLMGAALRYGEEKIRLIIPPIPVKIKYFAMFYGTFDLIGGVGRMDTGIAHFAHLGGAIAGFFLIMYWDKYGSKL